MAQTGQTDDGAVFKLPQAPFRPKEGSSVRPLKGGPRARELMEDIKRERMEQEEIEALWREKLERPIKMEQERQQAESAAKLNRSISQLELTEGTTIVVKSGLDWQDSGSDSHSSTDTDIVFSEEEGEEGSDDGDTSLYYW